MTCGENPTSTDQSYAEFIKSHTEEACPASNPAIDDSNMDDE